jgi:hypothetical protein
MHLRSMGEMDSSPTTEKTIEDLFEQQEADRLGLHEKPVHDGFTDSNMARLHTLLRKGNNSEILPYTNHYS